MTADQWARVKAVVGAALELPTCERQEFVERDNRVALGEALSLLKVETSEAPPTARRSCFRASPARPASLLERCSPAAIESSRCSTAAAWAKSIAPTT
jgi:hypothetical protein